jgi:hypothetical protein
MPYRVIKIVNGRRYFYEQRTWREGKRVRTESRYVGPADGPVRQKRLAKKIAEFVKMNLAREKAIIDEEKMLADYNARAAREQQERQSLLGELHDRHGLRVTDTPQPVVTAQQNPIAIAPASELGAKESPSIGEGQATQNS